MDVTVATQLELSSGHTYTVAGSAEEVAARLEAHEPHGYVRIEALNFSGRPGVIEAPEPPNVCWISVAHVVSFQQVLPPSGG